MCKKKKISIKEKYFVNVELHFYNLILITQILLCNQFEFNANYF